MDWLMSAFKYFPCVSVDLYFMIVAIEIECRNVMTKAELFVSNDLDFGPYMPYCIHIFTFDMRQHKKGNEIMTIFYWSSNPWLSFMNMIKTMPFEINSNDAFKRFKMFPFHMVMSKDIHNFRYWRCWLVLLTSLHWCPKCNKTSINDPLYKY